MEEETADDKKAHAMEKYEYMENLMDRVQTTSEISGYPRGLKQMFTSNCAEELQGFIRSAKAVGLEVRHYLLSKKDGHTLWYRAEVTEDYDLREANPYNLHKYKLNGRVNVEEQLFRALAGDMEIKDFYTLKWIHNLVTNLADEVGHDLTALDGAALFLDDDHNFCYIVKEDDTGFYYDTNHRCLAVTVSKEGEDDEL